MHSSVQWKAAGFPFLFVCACACLWVGGGGETKESEVNIGCFNQLFSDYFLS